MTWQLSSNHRGINVIQENRACGRSRAKGPGKRLSWLGSGYAGMPSGSNPTGEMKAMEDDLCREVR